MATKIVWARGLPIPNVRAKYQNNRTKIAACRAFTRKSLRTRRTRRNDRKSIVSRRNSFGGLQIQMENRDKHKGPDKSVYFVKKLDARSPTTACMYPPVAQSRLGIYLYVPSPFPAHCYLSLSDYEKCGQ